jgi:hypothetical protein
MQAHRVINTGTLNTLSNDREATVRGIASSDQLESAHILLESHAGIIISNSAADDTTIDCTANNCLCFIGGAAQGAIRCGGDSLLWIGGDFTGSLHISGSCTVYTDGAFRPTLTVENGVGAPRYDRHQIKFVVGALDTSTLLPLFNTCWTRYMVAADRATAAPGCYMCFPKRGDMAYGVISIRSTSKNAEEDAVAKANSMLQESGHRNRTHVIETISHEPLATTRHELLVQDLLSHGLEIHAKAGKYGSWEFARLFQLSAFTSDAPQKPDGRGTYYNMAHKAAIADKVRIIQGDLIEPLWLPDEEGSPYVVVVTGNVHADIVSKNGVELLVGGNVSPECTISSDRDLSIVCSGSLSGMLRASRLGAWSEGDVQCVFNTYALTCTSGGRLDLSIILPHCQTIRLEARSMGSTALEGVLRYPANDVRVRVASVQLQDAGEHPRSFAQGATMCQTEDGNFRRSRWVGSITQ